MNACSYQLIEIASRKTFSRVRLNVSKTMTEQELRSRVTKKGQITIPARLRRQFHIEAGKSVKFEKSADGIVMKPVPDIVDSAGELSKFASSTDMIRDLIQSRKKPFR